MTSILVKVVLFLLSQKPIQLYLLKKGTAILESESRETDAFGRFVNKHKRQIQTIVKKEVQLSESILDERFLNSLK